MKVQIFPEKTLLKFTMNSIVYIGRENDTCSVNRNARRKDQRNKVIYDTRHHEQFSVNKLGSSKIK